MHRPGLLRAAICHCSALWCSASSEARHGKAQPTARTWLCFPILSVLHASPLYRRWREERWRVVIEVRERRRKTGALGFSCRDRVGSSASPLLLACVGVALVRSARGWPAPGWAGLGCGLASGRCNLRLFLFFCPSLLLPRLSNVSSAVVGQSKPPLHSGRSPDRYCCCCCCCCCRCWLISIDCSALLTDRVLFWAMSPPPIHPLVPVVPPPRTPRLGRSLRPSLPPFRHFEIASPSMMSCAPVWRIELENRPRPSCLEYPQRPRPRTMDGQLCV